MPGRKETRVVSILKPPTIFVHEMRWYTMLTRMLFMPISTFKMPRNFPQSKLLAANTSPNTQRKSTAIRNYL